MNINRRIVSRIAAALSALLVVFCSVPVAVSHSVAQEIAYSAFTKPSLEVDSEALYKKSEILDDFSQVDLWGASDNVKSVERSTYTGGADCVLIKAEGDGVPSLTLMRDFSGETGAGIQSAGYEELSFSVVFGGNGASYDLSARIGTTDGERVYTCAVSPDVGLDVFLDISAMGATNITSFELTVSSSDSKYSLSYVAIASLMIGDVSHAEIARRYSALYVYGGEITDEGIKVTPKDGSATVRAEAVLPTGAVSEGSTAMISLTLKNVGYSKITMMTSSYPAWRKNNYKDMTSLTVTSETETYVFCFDSPDKIASWALSFEGLSTTGTDHFLIEDVTLDFGGSSGETNSYSNLGSISRCSYSADGSIVVSGSVDHEAVVDHIDGSIGLYLIPGNESTEKALNAEPAMVADISTSFTFNVDVEKFPIAPVCRFAVALIKDGNAAALCPPVWISPASTFLQDKLPQFIALSSSPADAFEFGADAAVIEVDVSKLIRPPNDTNSRLISRGDSIFYFNQSILSSVSDETAFYNAAGIKYYFRIVCSTDRFSAAPGIAGSYYAADVSLESNYLMMSAIVDYFSDRFSPAGYILGDRLNVKQNNTTQLFSDPFSLMEETAECARLIYSAALRYDANTVIILPFEAQSEEALNKSTSAEKNVRHSAITCTALADYYISRDQTPIRWASLVAADETNSSDIPSQAATNHGSGFIGTAIAPLDTDVTSYGELKDAFPLALFYASSVNSEDESIERDEVVSNVYAPGALPEEFIGSVTLWDFSKSFSTESFVLSNRKSLSTGTSPVFTKISARGATRALYLDLTEGADGIPVVAAAPLADGADLSSCSAIEFSLAAFSDSGAPSVVIHLGNGTVRLRYQVKLENGEAASVVCRLPSGVTPSYFAICNGEQEDVLVHLCAVRALSETQDSTALLANVFRTQEEETVRTARRDERFIQLGVAVIGGLTVAVFVILNRVNRIRNKKTPKQETISPK